MGDRLSARLLAGLFVLALTAACGSDVQQVAAPWKASARMLQGWQTISYRSVKIQVPGDYAVMGGQQWQCPNAANTVYLGRPRATMSSCPATTLPAGSYSTVSLDSIIPGFEHSHPDCIRLNGLRAELSDQSLDGDRGSLSAYLPDQGLRLSVAYWKDRAVAEAILQSAQKAA